MELLTLQRHQSRIYFHRHSRDRLGYEPVVVLLTDLQARGRRNTDLGLAQRTLRRFGLSTAYPSILQVDRYLTWKWGLDMSGRPDFPNYDSLFLSRRERRRLGRRGFVGTSLMAASSPWAFEEIAVNDGIFGKCKTTGGGGGVGRDESIKRTFFSC